MIIYYKSFHIFHENSFIKKKCNNKFVENNKKLVKNFSKNDKN